MTIAADPRTDKEAAWALVKRMRDEEARSAHNLWWRANAAIFGEKRIAIFEEANWRCCYCGIRLLLMEEGKNPCRQQSDTATVEHITRKADGGTDSRLNLAAACEWCNTRRGERDAMEWFRIVQEFKAAGMHPHFQTGTR